MKPNREDYERWIQQYLKPRFPELVKEFRACLSGYERIKANNRVDKHSLNAIVRAASSPRAPLLNTAIHFLSDLSGRYPEVDEAIVTMSNDKHWYVRCHAILSLDQETPRDIVLAILKKGLQDRSASVRRVVTWQAQSLRVSELIPDLENQLAIEPHSGAKHSIDFHLRLLRDGYGLEYRDGEPPFLWIPTIDGMRGCYVSQEDIDTKGIQVIIAENRKNPYG
jgi:hypothetical protein